MTIWFVPGVFNLLATNIGLAPFPGDNRKIRDTLTQKPLGP